MANKTKIEWADYISNPIKAQNGQKRGHACVKLSEGCAHCWASTFNVRLGTGLEYTVPNMQKAEMFLDEKEIAHMGSFKPRGPFKNGRSRPVVFPCDMTDLFGEWVPDAWINTLLAVFALRDDVDWFVLTKRPARMLEHVRKYCSRFLPPSNIYFGTSIENAKRAVERYEPMYEISQMGCHTWVSFEPALGFVNWGDWNFLRVLMCGGESGNQARLMLPIIARAARDFCQESGVKFFFKQWGEWAPMNQLPWVTEETTFKHKPIEVGSLKIVRVGKGMAGHCLDGREWREMP